MLLLQFNTRAATAIRLGGLALVGWTVVSGSPSPGTSGRALVVSISFGLAVVSWLVWTARAWTGPPQVTDWPLASEVFVLALAGGALTGASPSSAASAFAFVAVVAAGLRAELRRAIPVLAAAAVSLAGSVLAFNGSALGVLAYSLGYVAALLAASNTRGSVLRAEQAELLLAQTQRSHEEQLRVTRLEESTRIAREIHDVLAHALAGLTIQLEATATLVEQGMADREQLLERLRHAHALAREGLVETRRAVGALRGERSPSTARAVGEALEALAAEHRASSDAPAELMIDGDTGRLSPRARETVVRVVQEALTNVRKHAPGAVVQIRLDAGTGGGRPVLLVVADQHADRPAPLGELAASGGGFGLRGMRERAAQLGGTLEAGPCDGGWRVELQLPPTVALEASSEILRQ